MAINVGGEEAEAMSDINVTPLVDVMLVLLIIFIITIRVIIQQVQLDLPKATNLPTQTKPENITIAIDKQGDIYWNTKQLSGQDELKNKLRGIAREDPAPEVIDLTIDFDGTLLWNRAPVDRATLQSYISQEAVKSPQPEVHISVDKFAKYEIVAQTLADLQHRGLKKIGFVNNDYF